MTDPVTFTSTTPRHDLPYLIAGQAQKEVFVNEAFARVDALLQPVVGGSSTAPPAAPMAGDCWIVADGATGAWEGREDHLASWDGGQWTLHPPFAGLRVFDLAQGRMRTYAAGWDSAPEPADPAGGQVVDSEARAAVSAILAVLRAHRIIPGA
ncbi:MAG: DUF2793 domain-containing protein [Erythrobacter sp.]|jgi:hypothetical protein